MGQLYSNRSPKPCHYSGGIIDTIQYGNLKKHLGIILWFSLKTRPISFLIIELKIHWWKRIFYSNNYMMGKQTLAKVMINAISLLLFHSIWHSEDHQVVYFKIIWMPTKIPFELKRHHFLSSRYIYLESCSVLLIQEFFINYPMCLSHFSTALIDSIFLCI